MRPRTMPIKSSIPSGDPRVIRVLFGPNRGVFHEDLQLGVAAQVQHERAGARALEAQDSPGELEVSPRCQLLRLSDEQWIGSPQRQLPHQTVRHPWALASHG